MYKYLISVSCKLTCRFVFIVVFVRLHDTVNLKIHFVCCKNWIDSHLAYSHSQSSLRRSREELGCTLPSIQVCSDQRWQLSSAGDWLRGELLSAVTDKKDAKETKNTRREWQQRIEADGERIVSLDMDGEWVGEQRLSLSLVINLPVPDLGILRRAAETHPARRNQQSNCRGIFNRLHKFSAAVK